MKKFPTVQYLGKHLNSPYNPQKEAERVCDEIPLVGKSLFILFEPGFGYVIDALLSRCPRGTILIISPINEIGQNYRALERVSICERESISSFLLEHIHESDLSRIAYIPWPSAVRLMPEAAQKTGKEVKRALDIIGGNRSNTEGFGRSLVRNALVNFLTSYSPCLPQLNEKNVIIAASGPSLGRIKDELIARMGGYFLIALPSSVCALREWGIEPDLIISTDPGFWASLHYRFFTHSCPVGITLTGRTMTSNSNVFPLCHQGTFIESELLTGLSIPRVDEAGTVALTAIQFAQTLGAGEIITVGLDLSFDDIKSHLNPHSFDNYLIERTSRISPYQNEVFTRALIMTKKRSKGIRYGHALTHYRQWIETHHYPIKRYCPGTPQISGLMELQSLPHKKNQTVDWAFLDYPDREQKREIVAKKLTEWRIKYSQNLLSADFFTPFPSEEQDFIYSLFSEQFTQIRQKLFLGISDTGQERLLNDFNQLIDQWEALCDRLS